MPLVALMFQAPLFAYPLLMAALLRRGRSGSAAVGTLFAAMLVRARSRDVLLPILLYPITIPVIIAGVRGTAALLQPDVGSADGARVAVDAGVLRRRLHHTRAVDLRAGDDGMNMTKLFAPSAIVLAAMFAYAPLAIDRAPVRVDDAARAEDLLLPRARRGS